MRQAVALLTRSLGQREAMKARYVHRTRRAQPAGRINRAFMLTRPERLSIMIPLGGLRGQRGDTSQSLFALATNEHHYSRERLMYGSSENPARKL
jgi:hypothetical protein